LKVLSLGVGAVKVMCRGLEVVDRGEFGCDNGKGVEAGGNC